MTWEEVVKRADEAIAMYASLMNADPKNGMFYQQRMAYMLYLKACAQAKAREEAKHGT